MRSIGRSLIAMMLGLSAVAASAQDTLSFTYQGYLTNAGAPAQGSYDLLTGLYQSPSGVIPAPVGSQFHDNIEVADGVFTLLLQDPGTTLFHGAVLPWLEVCVRPGASTGSFTCLPRTPVTAVPRAFNADVAQFALSALPWSPVGNNAVLPNGRVGINQVGPTAPLDVRNSGANEQVIGNFVGANANGSWLNLGNSAGGGVWNMISTGSGNGEGANQLQFRGGAPAAVRMALAPDGHLGLNIGNSIIGDQAMLTMARNKPGYAVIHMLNYDPSGITGIAIGDGAIRSLLAHDTGAGRFSLRVGGGGLTERLVVQEADGFVGIGTTAPEARVHVFTGSAGSVTASTGSTLALESGADNYLQFLTPATAGAVGSGLRFGAGSNNFAAGLIFNPGNNALGLTLGTGASAIYVTPAGRSGVNRVPTANAFEVEGSASKSTAGDWAANSDARIKTDVRDIDDALGTIRRLHPVTFRYDDAYRAGHAGVGGGRYYNVIAQEFAQVFPEAVTSSGEFLAGKARTPDNAVLQVDTYPAQITAIAALQELDIVVQQQEQSLAAQQQRLQRQAAAIVALEARLAQLERRRGQDPRP